MRLEFWFSLLSVIDCDKIRLDFFNDFDVPCQIRDAVTIESVAASDSVFGDDDLTLCFDGTAVLRWIFPFWLLWMNRDNLQCSTSQVEVQTEMVSDQTIPDKSDL